jgi:hypothetical protein
MTISLLISRQPHGAVLLADPAGVSVEPVLAGVASQLDARRVIFPLSDRFPQRLVPPPSLMRGRHADLWHGLSEHRRDRVRLVAGPTAAFLAPLVPPDTPVLVALPDPMERRDAGRELWRSVLGAFPELDEAPDETGSGEERELWLTRIREAMSEVALVRVTDLNDLALELGASLGLSPKRSARLANVAEAAGAGGGARGDGDEPIHWLDEALYSMSRPPRTPPKRPRG